MNLFRRTFHLGRMNTDVDNRLLPQGEYRDARNVIIINSEDSDEGTVQKSFSFSKKTNLQLGANPIAIFAYSYEFRDRIYWGIKSDSGCYIIEWDNTTQSASFVLRDTRSVSSRVLNFKETHLITGVEIIPSDDQSRELMVITDDNMQPLCFNISRAKTYAENGFEEEDILLIKKPPRFEPTIQLTYTGGKENFLKEEILAFCYRYKYLDGEYSAFSGFTNYSFAPSQFALDYLTLENTAMQNSFNAVRIGFNTGDKRVTDIQLILKKSNSNTPYLIETLNKANEGWGNETTQTFLFSNNKTMIPLPEKELYRLFDNVPLKAKALTVIGNKLNYGNYLEGYNIVDANNHSIKLDYNLDIISNSLQGVEIFTVFDSDPDTATIGSPTMEADFTGLELLSGRRISFIVIMKASQEDPPGTHVVKGNFSGQFDFILNADYENAEAMAASEEFMLFVNTVMNNVFTQNADVEVPETGTLTASTSISFVASGNVITFTAPTYTYTLESTATVLYTWGFMPSTSLTFLEFSFSSSIKTNRSLEVGLLYLDKYGRSTTVLTGVNNTIYVPQDLLEFQNKLKVTVNHIPPYWADRYKIVVKHAPLTYFTIYGVLFYEDGPYRWVRLDGANKDKVVKDDILILKADNSGPITDVIEVYVIDVVNQEENFISGNADEGGDEIIEEPGLYMKIKASGINMETTGENYFNYFDDVLLGQSTVTLGPVVGTLDEGTGDYVDIPIQAGSRINIIVKADDMDSDADVNFIYNQDFISQNSYASFEDWFNIEFIGLGEYDDNVQLSVSRNENNGILFIATKTPNYFGYLYLELTVQLSTAVTIFETQPKSADIDIFYETGQTFEVKDGVHLGNLQNQNETLPAIIESSFFNCYNFSNGAESYRVKDLINKNFLNIDLKPNLATIEPYKQVRRQADITYSEAYIESLNINGLNVFNLSTANFKELEKAFGSIQKLYARDTNIVVFQEEKVGQVLYEKDAVYTADGSDAITSIPGVLGQYIPYQGSIGIGKNPESFSIDDDGRIKYVSTRKGVVARLSNDGITPIVYGKKDFFRDLFREQPNAKILMCHDPYLGLDTLAVGNEPVRVAVFGCSTNINKFNQSLPYTYDFQLNSLGGDIIINYNITSGNATITADFNGNTYVESNVTGEGNLTISRDSLIEDIVTVTITPVSEVISYSLGNSCPIGSALKIVMVVLNDEEDSGDTMTNRFKAQGSPFHSTNDIFNDGPWTRFETINGTEGVGVFPANGSLVTLQAFQDTINSGHFATSECNRLGYLVTDTVYNSGNINTILANATFLAITTSGEGGLSETNSGSFVFSRDEVDEILYLIWDYTNRQPVLSDDTANATLGGSVIINVLDNDEVSEDAVVTIPTQPSHGTAEVNPDRTITYTHDGSENFEDSFPYTVTEGGCSSTATVTIIIGLSCGDTLSASGGVGINEILINFGTAIGWCGVEVNAQSVPDRFELYWDDVKVADSLYIGDGINPGPPTSYPGLLGEKTLSVLEYNGSPTPPMFDDTGVDETFTIIQDDISDNETTPTDGNTFLVYNKTTALPATAKLRIIGPVGGTAFNINDIICPTPEEELVTGEEKFVYGFFTEANKGNSNKSIKLYLGSSPVKFYTNVFGYTNFSMYGEFTTNKFINDGVTWWEIDATGNIVSTGSL